MENFEPLLNCRVLYFRPIKNDVGENVTPYSLFGAVVFSNRNWMNVGMPMLESLLGFHGYDPQSLDVEKLKQRNQALKEELQLKRGLICKWNPPTRRMIRLRSLRVQ